MWEIDFISEENFKEHVRNTITHYGDKLKPYNLKRFNSNTVDPVKLIFDRNVYRYSWDEIIKNEIFRQRDKSNNNDIGYFHQRIFSYIDGCTVPPAGWDVIVQKNEPIRIREVGEVSTVYVEMKNKHNTMNSASSAKTYMKMQGQLLEDDDCVCMLVEAIAKQSQDITWAVSVDGAPQRHRRIRRVSMDKFYEIVTGEADAFYQVCMALPEVIEEVVAEAQGLTIPQDTVIEELGNCAAEVGSFEMALYLLGFKTYMGFN